MPGNQHEPPLHASSKRWFRRLPLIGLVAILVSGVVGLFFLRSSDPSEQAVAEEVKVIEQRVREGKHEDAIRSLDRLQKHRNLPPDLAFRMAQLAMDLDAIPLAETFLDRAESSASFKAKVVYLRGVLALKGFRAAQAETLWKAAVNLNPKFVLAWERLAPLAMSQMRGAELRAALDGLRTARPLSLDELVVYSSAFEPYVGLTFQGAFFELLQVRFVDAYTRFGGSAGASPPQVRIKDNRVRQLRLARRRGSRDVA